MYGYLTVNAAVPQEFAISYHQCRWNYNNQEDVNIEDEHDIPMDVIKRNTSLGTPESFLTKWQ